MVEGSDSEDRSEIQGDSTLLRMGKAALTFGEMERFARDVGERQLPKLLEELESLVALPEAKYHLFAVILRKRYRACTEEEGTRILEAIAQVGRRNSQLRPRAEELVGQLRRDLTAKTVRQPPQRG